MDEILLFGGLIHLLLIVGLVVLVINLADDELRVEGKVVRVPAPGSPGVRLRAPGFVSPA